MNEDLIKRINTLESELATLSKQYFTNNFSAQQDFNKKSRFINRLRVPHYSSAPATAETGEIIEVGGKLYIASAADTWTLVGGQTA